MRFHHATCTCTHTHTVECSGLSYMLCTQLWLWLGSKAVQISPSIITKNIDIFFNATQIVNFNNKIFLQKINFMQHLFLLTHLLVQAWYSIHSSGQRLSSIQYIVHTQARDRDKTQYRPSYLQINTEQHQLEFIIFSFSGRLFCDLKTIFKVKFWLSFRF